MSAYNLYNIALNVLIVEDDVNLALVQKRRLEADGHHIFIADSGEFALEIMEKEKIHVVLLDQKLPTMAGAEVFARIVHKGFDVAVVMITGKRDEKLAEQIVAFGAEDYVVKDISLSYINALPRIVIKSWKQHQLKRENKRLTNELMLLKDTLVAFLNHISDLVFIMDTNNRIIMANQAFYKTLGIKKEDVLGRTCYSLFHGKDSFVEDCPYLETLETKSAVSKKVFEPKFNTTMLMTTIPVFDYDGAIKQVIHYCKPLSKEGDVTQFSDKIKEITVSS
jgi:PAS domain S-box-containing protein